MWAYKILKEQLIFFYSECCYFLYIMCFFWGLVYFFFSCIVYLASFHSSIYFRSTFKIFSSISHPSFFRRWILDICLREMTGHWTAATDIIQNIRSNNFFILSFFLSILLFRILMITDSQVFEHWFTCDCWSIFYKNQRQKPTMVFSKILMLMAKPGFTSHSCKVG